METGVGLHAPVDGEGGVSGVTRRGMGKRRHWQWN